MRCQYYRIGVTSFEKNPSSGGGGSMGFYFRTSEWCEHPKLKQDLMFAKVPCGGEKEKCVLAPHWRRLHLSLR